MNLRVVFIGLMIVLACTSAICQNQNSSVLNVMNNSSFFQKLKTVNQMLLLFFQ
jgi:hypothetical protein